MAAKCILISLFLVIILGLFICTEEEEGIFPDPDLEASVREAIDKPEGVILASELEGLTFLAASVFIIMSGQGIC